MMLTSVILARGLGPEGRGEYAVALRIVGLLIAFGQFGLPEAMLYQMRDDPHRGSALAANSLMIVLVATGVSAVVLWITVPIFSDSFYKGTESRLLWTAFLFLPTNLLFIFFARLIQLSGRLRVFNLLTLTSRCSMTIAIFVLLTIWPGEASSAIVGLLASSMLVTVCAVILLNKLVVEGMWGVNLTVLATSIRKGLNVQWGLVAHFLCQSSGVFILNHFLGLSHVGLYATALGVATMVLIVPEAMRTVLQSWMTGVARNQVLVTEQTLTFARQVIVVLGCAALGLAIVGHPVITTLYGEEFSASYSPMVILAIGMVFRGVAQLVTSQLALGGFMTICSFGAVIALLVNISCSWTLVPTLGMLGAAYGDAIGNIMSLIFLLSWFFRKTNGNVASLIPRLSDFKFFVR